MGRSLVSQLNSLLSSIFGSGRVGYSNIEQAELWAVSSMEFVDINTTLGLSLLLHFALLASAFHSRYITMPYQLPMC